jgi:hypothetical protein
MLHYDRFLAHSSLLIHDTFLNMRRRLSPSLPTRQLSIIGFFLQAEIRGLTKLANLIPEYYRGRLQSNPVGKLCTHSSA